MTRRWIVVDILVVLLFVGIGRPNHHHVVSISGMASTTWPFAAGLAIGWLIVLVRHQNGVSLGAGVEVWLATVCRGDDFASDCGSGHCARLHRCCLGFLRCPHAGAAPFAHEAGS